jgi:hypothetical protein
MTVDAEFKQLGEDHIRILNHTRDSCDKENLVTITSTTDGDVELLPGLTRYFRIKKFDGYTKSGGWYWKCGNTEEQSRITWGSQRGVYIKAVRTGRGVIDWYSVSKITS